MLTTSTVLAQTKYRSRSTLYAAIRAGVFTKPVRMSDGALGWPSAELIAINAAWAAGESAVEVRELVNQLHSARIKLGPLEP
jgi:prophage regulatory protein